MCILLPTVNNRNPKECKKSEEWTRNIISITYSLTNLSLISLSYLGVHL
jgi:hypothetical protein